MFTVVDISVLMVNNAFACCGWSETVQILLFQQNVSITYKILKLVMQNIYIFNIMMFFFVDRSF